MYAQIYVPMSRFPKSRKAVLSLAVASLYAQGAFAQSQSPAPAQESSQGTQVEEIVVTAQRRSENLQNVPIAVTAVTGASIANSGLLMASDLPFSVPSLSVQENTASTIFFLRGVGTAFGSPGLDSAIALFVDGVYIPSMAGSLLSLNNIERVEVLKGPQGTLYGRNATGGAINIITKTPSNDGHIDGYFGYGNLNTTEASLYATVGLTDKIASDVAVFYHDQRDGFGTNLFNGKDVNRSVLFNIRSKIRIDFSDTANLTLAADHDEAQTSFGDALRAVPTSALLDGQRGYTGGYFNTDTDNVPLVIVKHTGGAATYAQGLGKFEFTSISAYRYQGVYQNISVDATPLGLLVAPLFSYDGQFTEELQLAYSAQTLNAVLGAFYLNGYNSYDPFQIVGGAVAPLSALFNTVRQGTKSYAVFGQATYEVVPDTNLTVGLRYTRDQRDFTARQQGIVGGNAITLGPNVSEDAAFSKPTWRFALDHKLAHDDMIYVSYNRGFKSGVYNLSSPNDPVVKPETLDAYEIGLKSLTFDQRLRFNPAVYYYNYKNIQLDQARGTTTELFNAATAHIYGADADLTLAVNDHLTVESGAAYTHARYATFPDAPISTVNPAPIPGDTVVVGSASGNHMILVPAYTFNLSPTYHVPLAKGEISATASYAYNSGFYWAADNRVRQGGFGLTNAQVKWAAAGGRYNVRVWGRNLFNIEHLATLNETSQGDYGAPAPGRMYGVAFGFSF